MPYPPRAAFPVAVPGPVKRVDPSWEPAERVTDHARCGLAWCHCTTTRAAVLAASAPATCTVPFTPCPLEKTKKTREPSAVRWRLRSWGAQPRTVWEAMSHSLSRCRLGASRHGCLSGAGAGSSAKSRTHRDQAGSCDRTGAAAPTRPSHWGERNLGQPLPETVSVHSRDKASQSSRATATAAGAAASHPPWVLPLNGGCN